MVISLSDLQSRDLSRLDVYVSGRKVGKLSREGARRYILNYLPDTSPLDYVSISMPVRAESWVFEGKLHPFFEMNLPEGIRREIIAATFGKAMISEEMGLLAIVGNDSIGRVQIVPEGLPINWKETCLVDVNALNESDTDAFFADALTRYASQGVSGVQPKVLLSDHRLTLKSNQWIMKHDGNDSPGLSFNEYLSMEAARQSGLTVPRCLLTSDGKSLLVERFDLNSGFEDFCSLLGLPPVEKYSGSIERMLKIASLIVNQDRIKMKEDILKSIIVNVCLGNGDAHLKNFGILYHDKKVGLAPFFDIVSVRAFDQFKHDIPALMIAGKKEWVIGKAFKVLAINAGLSSGRIDSMIEEVNRGVLNTLPLISDLAEKYPEHREMAKRMLVVWHNGLKRIHGEKIDHDDASVLQSMRFSDLITEKAKTKRAEYIDSSDGYSPGF